MIQKAANGGKKCSGSGIRSKVCNPIPCQEVEGNKLTSDGMYLHEGFKSYYRMTHFINLVNILKYIFLMQKCAILDSCELKDTSLTGYPNDKIIAFTSASDAYAECKQGNFAPYSIITGYYN